MTERVKRGDRRGLSPYDRESKEREQRGFISE